MHLCVYLGIIRSVHWPNACVCVTCISLRSLSWRFCSGSMKFCLTFISKASFTSPSSRMDSPASNRAKPDTHRKSFHHTHPLSLSSEPQQEIIKSFTKAGFFSELPAELSHGLCQDGLSLRVTRTLLLTPDLRHGVDHAQPGPGRCRTHTSILSYF